MPPCAFCGGAAELKCTSCANVYYCSKEHQKRAWPAHKAVCMTYRMVEDASMGRHLIANRDIRAGELIMKKRPLIAGPKMMSAPICMGCCKNLSADFAACPGCGWGLCDVACGSSKWHSAECRLLACASVKPKLRIDAKDSTYSVILPLRTMLLKSINRKRFDQFMALQSHLDDNRKRPIYAMLERSVIPAIKKIYASTNDKDAPDPLVICSIFDTNAFSVRNENVNIRAVYPTISFMAHDCTPNTKHHCDDDFAMSVIATVNIKKGAPITTSYAQSLWPTLPRRKHLLTTKHFDCECRRCADPSEFQTFAGSLKCMECGDGLLISTRPLQATAAWRCTGCTREVSSYQVETLNTEVRSTIFQCEKTASAYERLLIDLAHLLHPTSAHALEIKLALAQLYSLGCGGAADSSAFDARRVELCQELLEVAEKFEPGLSTFRDKVLSYHPCPTPGVAHPSPPSRDDAVKWKDERFDVGH